MSILMMTVLSRVLMKRRLKACMNKRRQRCLMEVSSEIHPTLFSKKASIRSRRRIFRSMMKESYMDALRLFSAGKLVWA